MVALLLAVAVMNAIASTPIFSESSPQGAVPDKWTLKSGASPWGKIIPAPKESGGGLDFTVPTSATAFAPWEIGVGPFEFWFDAEITGGTSQGWRYEGIALALCSAPPAEMTAKDVAISCGIYRAGIQCTIKKGPFRQSAADAKEIPRYFQVWVERQEKKNVRSYELTRQGDGGEHYSIAWTEPKLAGTRVRFHIQRFDDNRVKFEVFDPKVSLSRPHWSGETMLPPDLASVPIRGVAVVSEVDEKEPPKDVTLVGRLNRFQGWTGTVVCPEIRSYVSGENGLVNGEAFRVMGSGFTNGSVVLINGKPCRTVFKKEGELEVFAEGLTPDSQHSLEVVNPDGLFTEYGEGVQAGCALAECHPRSISPKGGEVVTIKGGGFTPSTKISFNGKDVQIVERKGSDFLQVKAPPGDVGRVTVTASNGAVAFSGAPTLARVARPSLVWKNPEQLAAWRKQFADPRFGDYRAAILGMADRILSRKVELGDGRKTADSFTPLLWSYLLTGDRKYKDGLDLWMDCILQRRSIQSYAFMESGGVAIAYDSLFDEWSPEWKTRFEAYLIDALESHERQRGGYFLEEAHNSQVVMNGSAGIVALGIRDIAPAGLAERSIEYVNGRLREWAKEMVTGDGGYREGTIYFYSMPIFLLYSDALQNVAGKEGGLLSEAPQMQKFGDFMAVIYGADGSQVTFGDTQPWMAGIAQSAALGARFHDPRLLAFAELMARGNARWERIYSENPRPQGLENKNYREMLLKKYRQTPTAAWPDMSDRGLFLPYGFLWRGLEPVEELSLPTMATLEKIHWGVLRSSPKNPDLVLQAKGRPSGMLQFHEIHQDGGSFVLQAGGDPILIDPGYFPGMQNAGADAAKHSVPVIDGRVPVGGLPGYNGRSIPEFASVITNAWEKQNQRGFTIDTTLPYSDPAQKKIEKKKESAADDRPAPAPRRVHRVFVMNGSEGVVVLDDIVPGEGAPGAIVTRFQTAQIPEIQDGANELTLSGWKTKVGMQIDGEGAHLR